MRDLFLSLLDYDHTNHFTYARGMRVDLVEVLYCTLRNHFTQTFGMRANGNLARYAIVEKNHFTHACGMRVAVLADDFIDIMNHFVYACGMRPAHS